VRRAFKVQWRLKRWSTKAKPQDPLPSSPKPIVDFLFATGMRVGEAASLDIQDFVLEQNVFRVKGKGGRDRLPFLVDEETVRVQRQHRQARARIEPESKSLFLNASAERLSTQGITVVLRNFGGRPGSNGI